MASTYVDARDRVGAPGAEMVLLSGKNVSEDTPPHRIWQSRRVAERFGLDLTTAGIVADLAYSVRAPR